MISTETGATGGKIEQAGGRKLDLRILSDSDYSSNFKGLLANAWILE